MPTRASWENAYALAYRTTAINASDSATSGLFVASNDGIPAIAPAGEFGFLLDEKPGINPGVEITTVEKATGLAQPQTGASGIGVELNIARKLPTISVGGMGLTPEKVEVLAWSLFQKGATESGIGPYTKQYIPYVQGMPDPEMWLDIATNIGDPASATGYGQLLAGAICTQLSISGSQGDRYTLSAEFQGRTYRNDYIHTASIFTAEATVDHVFLDYSWTLAGTAANLQSFDFQIINNAVPVYYNSLVPTGFILHRMAATGTFALAMSTATIGDWTQMDNYVTGTDILVVGTGPSSAVVWTINAKYTGGEVDPAETELLLSLPYEGVYDGTNHAIQVDTSTSIQRSIPA